MFRSISPPSTPNLSSPPSSPLPALPSSSIEFTPLPIAKSLLDPLLSEFTFLENYSAELPPPNELPPHDDDPDLINDFTLIPTPQESLSSELSLSPPPNYSSPFPPSLFTSLPFFGHLNSNFPKFLSSLQSLTAPLNLNSLHSPSFSTHAVFSYTFLNFLHNFLSAPNVDSIPSLFSTNATSLDPNYSLYNKDLQSPSFSIYNQLLSSFPFPIEEKNLAFPFHYSSKIQCLITPFLFQSAKILNFKNTNPLHIQGLKNELHLAHQLLPLAFSLSLHLLSNSFFIDLFKTPLTSPDLKLIRLYEVSFKSLLNLLPTLKSTLPDHPYTTLLNDTSQFISSLNSLELNSFIDSVINI